MLAQAFDLHRQGRLAEAQAIYENILKQDPRHFDALNLLATIAVQTRNFAAAVPIIERALKVNPNAAFAHDNMGSALLGLGRADEALASYDKAVRLDPSDPIMQYNRGNALLALRRPRDAVASYDKCVALNPEFAEAHNNRGTALRELKQWEEALASFEKALALRPGLPEPHNNCANVLLDLGRPGAAVAHFDKAIALRPDDADAHNNRGNALFALGQWDDALASFERAITLKPGQPDAHGNRGNALRLLKRLPEALESYDRALAIKPDHARSHHNRANVLVDLKRPDEALVGYDKALALEPDLVDAHISRGNALVDLRRPDEALKNYEKALALKPDYPLLRGMVAHTRMKLCDWRGLNESISVLRTEIEAGRKVTPPFPMLALVDEPKVHLQAAKIQAAKYPASPRPVRRRARSDRIRIGYYSSDFHDHPVGRVVAELFEAHDRTRFETFGFSLGVNKQDEIRRRIFSALGQAHDVRDKTDAAIAALSRELGIDIAVDLNGHTLDARTGIFAQGCAPVQVNYLGYPGTMSASYIDYIVADEIVIPAGRQDAFTEKVITLLPSLHFVSARQKISERAMTREEFGLPAAGFVFCCFNNSYKILPDVFDAWMRLLKSVDGSVLWLKEDSATAVKNLRKEAAARGVDGGRLVFAKSSLPLDEHLARHGLADLFIDTLPYNAHMTACDALRAGLPVLTCAGKSFASRVGASLLHAIDLAELVTDSLKDYEAKAFELATNPSQLADIRRKLAGNRLSRPLFDAKSFARNLEAAYVHIHERYHAGLEPESFKVS